MITIGRLKQLIKDLPDDAKCYAYEGEDVGIVIYVGENIYVDGSKYWFIRAGDIDKETTYTEGFTNESTRTNR